MKHKLVFGGSTDNVEDEVERVLVHGEMAVIQYDIRWEYAVDQPIV
jgi:hypothetical protein